VRWKPPPASSKSLGGTADIGWRVEFRSMEVQLTDFENAAFTVFTVLASRVMLFFDLNLYLPLSQVDENMRRAQKRDAVKTERFFFSQSLMPADDGACPAAPASRWPSAKEVAEESAPVSALPSELRLPAALRSGPTPRRDSTDEMTSPPMARPPDGHTPSLGPSKVHPP
jgi:glutamate--cysteine ligase catalytic subunit